ncbi:hypothetical protein ZWY2020_043555 [Hordeum vulgare]|nr:hypothetical protein ZWY2020_043555 [Hordeum vulgare]
MLASTVAFVLTLVEEFNPSEVSVTVVGTLFLSTFFLHVSFSHRSAAFSQRLTAIRTAEELAHAAAPVDDEDAPGEQPVERRCDGEDAATEAANVDEDHVLALGVDDTPTGTQLLGGSDVLVGVTAGGIPPLELAVETYGCSSCPGTHHQHQTLREEALFTTRSPALIGGFT